MIELRNDSLNFEFPEVHPDASCSINFQRTLRIPDDNQSYPLPPGLGNFPIKHVDDYVGKLPENWITHGGVFIPMYQSEALWVNFNGRYPCAVKVAAGKINAVDGEPWRKELSNKNQDYAVIPEQPWLDGFNVSDDFIRQFVAMPLGEGYTAEEQITGKAEHGGLQIIVYPMKRSFYKEYRNRQDQHPNILFSVASAYMEVSMGEKDMDMGLAPGGLMQQEIYDDPHGYQVWDQDNGLRCFVHLVNSETYTSVTGERPPHSPPKAKDYNNAGLPWFDYYSDNVALGGSKILGGLTSLGAKHIEKKGQALPENNSVEPKIVKSIGCKDTVRQGEF